MLPPCSLETVHVEVGEVLMMTCQSIEVTRWVKVLDKIDPYPSTIIHQTEMALRGEVSSYLKPTLTQKKVTSKRKGTSTKQWFSSPSIISSADFQEFSCQQKRGGCVYGRNIFEGTSLRYKISHCRSQLSRAPSCAKAQQGRNCGGFFSRKVVGMGKHDKL